ncbi:MAG: hypothetical protein WA941_01390 [Nitrososphaeraceae archaeon]
MSKLIVAIMRKIGYINKTEYRPTSYDDLKVVEIEGKLQQTDYGTVRNIMSALIKEGRVECPYNSKAAFFVLKGIKFGKQKRQDLEMKRLANLIQSLPESSRGLHDIHLKFSVLDIWKILFNSGKFKPKECSNDILLPPFTTNGMKIKVIVHRTDTVTVSVACSNNPVNVSAIEDAEGVIRLAKALAKTEISISRVLDECGQIVPGGYESIPIPDSDSWIVMMWHFAVDSPSYKEERICMTWKDGQAVLLREYKKKKNQLRREQQEYPKISFGEARKKLFDSTQVDERNEESEDTQEKNKKM